jgi:hypothetical protein
MRHAATEFDLHVLKKPGACGRPALFTLGVWDGLLKVRSVCHIAPIEDALVALRQILETPGNAAADDCRADTRSPN